VIPRKAAIVVSTSVFLAGLTGPAAEAGPSPITTPTTAALGVTPSLAAPVMGDYADTVNAIGRDSYSSTYSGDRLNPDGSVTMYVGPGDDTPLVAATTTSLDVPRSAIAGLGTSGALPAVNVVRVPRSEATLDSGEDAVVAAQGTLTNAGYEIASIVPAYDVGILQVSFAKAPTATTVASATQYLDAIAPGAQVMSLDSPLSQGLDSRYGDRSPWYGGDYVDVNGYSFCTTGFVVYSYRTGAYAALTDAHCGEGTFSNVTNTGNIGGPIGTSLTWSFTNGYDTASISPVAGTVFNSYVWGGVARSTSPPAYRVGGNVGNYPAIGEMLTYDGGATGEAPGVPVTQDDVCETISFSGSAPQLICNLVGTANVSVTGYYAATYGDSGGPVYSTYYLPSQGLITPVGEIESASFALNANDYFTFIVPDPQENDAAIPVPPTAPPK
jgi:hypothetical protein